VYASPNFCCVVWLEAHGLARIVDPWFNFRASKYLVKNGFYSFWDWFDDRKTSMRPNRAIRY
jgi:hypothetical protein